MLPLLGCSFLSSALNPSTPNHSNRWCNICDRRQDIYRHVVNKRRPAFIFHAGAKSTDTTSSSDDTVPISQKPYETNGANDTILSAESLSDVDARVLQSILQDPQFLDSIMKDNIQQILSEPRIVQPSQSSKQRISEQQTSAEYNSAFFKSMEQLDASQFFNSVKAKADEIIESFQILVSNRVERDLKLLTSLGVFAWQRIVKDVARALPASGKSSANMAKMMRDALFQLSSNSSFVPYISKENFILPPSKYSFISTQDLDNTLNDIYQQPWNSPLDEIQSVTATIRDILAGKTSLSINDLNTIEDRTLKSVAPAGYAKSSERQRRAYQRKKERILNRERESLDAKIGRAMGSVSDTVWEITREFQAEGNEPGYRVETLVRSLREVVDNQDSIMTLEESTSTSRYFLDDPQEDMGDNIEDDVNIEYNDESVALFNDYRLTLSILQDERARFVSGIRRCLEQPQNTWLAPEVVQLDTPDSFKQEVLETSLRDVIAAMILSRDNVEADIENCEKETEATYYESRRITEFQKLKQMVESIVSLAAIAAGTAAAQRLKDEIIHRDGTISLLESILDNREIEKRRSLEVGPTRKSGVLTLNKDERNGSQQDMVIDAVVELKQSEWDKTLTDDHPSIDWDAQVSNKILVISDDEYIKSLNLRVTGDVSISSEKTDNPMILVTLRALDVLFFVLEKAIAVGLPTIVSLGTRVVLALEELENRGMGRTGWKLLKNLKEQKLIVDN